MNLIDRKGRTGTERSPEKGASRDLGDEFWVKKLESRLI